jgi:hypothetical protein
MFRPRTIFAVALLLASPWGLAQDNCGITLPYRLEQISGCTPKSAAAYDLAFCGVSYSNAEEPFKSKAAAYFKISQGLTDAETLGKNVILAKNYYGRMQAGQKPMPIQTLEYIRDKCANVETQHKQVLEELWEQVKRQQEKKKGR